MFSDVEKTTDGGYNWFNQTVPSGNYYSIQFTDTSIGWTGGSKLLHTTDGGGPPVGITPISNEVPSEFKLYQNYPNPFNPSTNIKYQIVNNKYVKIVVYDVIGKEIITLVNGKHSATGGAGTYEVDFDGSNLPSGVYFYSLIVDGIIKDTKKMILLK